MAWLFGIAAECGCDKDAAEELIEHFDDFSFDDNLITNRIFKDPEDNWWAHVLISELTESKFLIAKTRLENHALNAPFFRYGLAGLETDEFRYFSELKEDVGKLFFDRLILNRKLWSEWGEPKEFEVRNETYVIERLPINA